MILNLGYALESFGELEKLVPDPTSQTSFS